MAYRENIGAGIVDHGGLLGLGDDDHTQYLRADGTRALTGAWAVGTQNITGINWMICSSAFITSMTAGSILFAVSGGGVTQNNSRLFWDNTNYRLGLGTAVPLARLHVLAASGNVSIIQTAAAASDDVIELKAQESVQTTDATTTTIQTLSTVTDSVNHLDVVVTGRRTGGLAGANGDCASYKYAATVKNVGGVLSYVGGTVSNLYPNHEDQAAWGVGFSSSGTNILIRVTGAVDNTIRWHVTTTMQYHST